MIRGEGRVISHDDKEQQAIPPDEANVIPFPLKKDSPEESLAMELIRCASQKNELLSQQIAEKDEKLRQKDETIKKMEEQLIKERKEREVLAKQVEQHIRQRLAWNCIWNVNRRIHMRPVDTNIQLSLFENLDSDWSLEHNNLPYIHEHRDANRKLNKNNSSGFNGVSEVESGKFRSYYWIENTNLFPDHQKQLPLGTYDSAEIAAWMHDIAAMFLDGAATKKLNFPDLRSEYMKLLYKFDLSDQ